MSNDTNIQLDSNGQAIEAGKRYIYQTTRGSMCDVDIKNRDGVLWGIGSFTEHKLETWLKAQDFESIVLSDEQPIGDLSEHMMLDEFMCNERFTEYGIDYGRLHEVWEKFRELRFEESSIEHCRYTREHADHCAKIGKAMIHGTLTGLYNALVQAVKWYNEVKK